MTSARPKVEVHPLEAREAHEVAALSARVFSANGAWTRDQLLAELRRASAEVWVARVDGLLAGFVIGSFGDPSYGEGAEILSLASDESARRRGVGRALVERVQASTIARNVRSLTLEVRRDNEPAKALYARTGFVEIGLRRRYYSDGEDALVMEWSPPARDTTRAPG